MQRAAHIRVPWYRKNDIDVIHVQNVILVIKYKTMLNHEIADKRRIIYIVLSSS